MPKWLNLAVEGARTSGCTLTELEKRLDEQQTFGDDLLIDDARTLTGINFQVGSLVAGDQAMATYLKWVSRFPKASPAVAFQ